MLIYTYTTFLTRRRIAIATYDVQKHSTTRLKEVDSKNFANYIFEVNRSLYN